MSPNTPSVVATTFSNTSCPLDRENAENFRRQDRSCVIAKSNYLLNISFL